MGVLAWEEQWLSDLINWSLENGFRRKTLTPAREPTGIDPVIMRTGVAGESRLTSNTNSSPVIP